MPTYQYYCKKCDDISEHVHSIKDDPIIKCEECNRKLKRMVGIGCYVISGGIDQKIEDYKESEHKKKVKDFERAIRNRKKHFGVDSVGNPDDKPDPRHIVKRGKTLGGAEKEINREEFVKAAAKDKTIVNACQKALRNKAK